MTQFLSKLSTNICFAFRYIQRAFKLWVPFKADFPGQSLIIKGIWQLSKKGWFYVNQNWDWDSTLTWFGRLGPPRQGVISQHKDLKDLTKTSWANLGNSNNYWDCAADAVELSAVVVVHPLHSCIVIIHCIVALCFIRCNCNSALIQLSHSAPYQNRVSVHMKRHSGEMSNKLVWQNIWGKRGKFQQS